MERLEENRNRQSSADGPVMFLTSDRLMNEFIMFENIYSLSFHKHARASARRANVPRLSPALMSEALKDFMKSLTQAAGQTDANGLHYQRIQIYLTSLFSKCPEESEKNFSALSPVEKALIGTVLHTLFDQIPSTA